MAEVVKYCGTVTGKDTDKIDELNLEHFKGKLGLPLFKDAKAGFECKVISQILSGDHTIFIGEVKYCWLNEEKSTLVMYPQK